MKRSLHNDDLCEFKLSSQHGGYDVQMDWDSVPYNTHMRREMERSKLQRAVHKAERCLFFAKQEQTHFHEASHSGINKIGPRARFATNDWSHRQGHFNNCSFYDSSQCTEETSDEDFMNLQSPQEYDEIAEDMHDNPERASMLMACEQVSNAILQDRAFSPGQVHQRMHRDAGKRVGNEMFTDRCNSAYDFEPMNWSSPTDEEAMLVEQILQCSRAAQK